MLDKLVLTQVDEMMCVLPQSVHLERCPSLAGVLFSGGAHPLVTAWQETLLFSPPLVS